MTTQTCGQSLDKTSSRYGLRKGKTAGSGGSMTWFVMGSWILLKLKKP